MADGSTKAIEDVKVGDEVLAADPATGERGAPEVTNLITGTGHKDLIKITVDTDRDGHGDEKITATDGHSFWVHNHGRWVDASDLRPGDMLRTSAGTWIQITAVREYTRHQTVHNLTVSGIHTYHVLAGATPVLVHNCGGLDDLAGMRKDLGAPSPDDVVLARLDVGGQSFHGSAHGQRYARPSGVTPQSMGHAEADAFGQAGLAGVRGGVGRLYVDGKIPCSFCRSSLAGFAKSLDLDELRVFGPNGYIGLYQRGGGYRTITRGMN